MAAIKNKFETYTHIHARTHSFLVDDYGHPLLPWLSK